MRSLLTASAAALLMCLATVAAHAAPPAAAPPEVPPSAQSSDAFDEGDPRVEARLLVDQRAVAAGGKLRVGVLLTPDPEWHVYWRYSGDAGIPTAVKWSLPEGATAGPLIWPAPQTFSESGGFILTYGYGQLLVWSEVTLPAGAAGEVEIGAEVDYLTCRESCIPGAAMLTRAVQIAPAAPSAAEAALFDATAAHVPTPITDRRMSASLALDRAALVPGATVQAAITVALCASPGGDCAPLELDPAGAAKIEHAFIPDRSERIVWRPQSIKVSAAQEVTITLSGKIAAGDGGPALIDGYVGGVLRLKDAAGAPSHTSLSLSLSAAKPLAAAPAAGLSVVDAAPIAPAAPPEVGVLWALVLAFFGGLLLNFMPCVFPVLSLKLAMLARMSGQDRGHMARHGLAYAAGIASAMLALALVVLGLRAAGEQVGWGFQFQNPWFLIFLCAVVATFTANLLGAFEIGTPQLNTHGKLPEHGAWQSFAEGLLCVLLATPCSAPFMGTAVGFALASDAPTIIAILQALGLGLASPFVLLTVLPGWQRFLPKPGPWFDLLRQGLAFALLATLVWLLWVFGQTQGTDGMARLAGFLIALSMAAWVWGIVQYAPARKRAVGALLATLIAGSAGWGLLAVKAPGTSAERPAAEGPWRAYDEAAIKAELAAGRPVFVDFTADWCISCKVNEHGALADASVTAAFASHDVVLFKADWTERDERIRAILARYGKAGVPMYLVYSPARPDQPEVLPELLTAGLVVEAIGRAAAR